MKVLCVSPTFPETYWGQEHALRLIGKRALLPPLGLLTIAALLPPDWEVRLCDTNVRPLSDADLAWADVIFLTGMLVQRPSMLEVARRARALGKLIVAGGPHATATASSWARPRSSSRRFARPCSRMVRPCQRASWPASVPTSGVCPRRAMTCSTSAPTIRSAYSGAVAAPSAASSATSSSCSADDRAPRSPSSSVASSTRCWPRDFAARCSSLTTTSSATAKKPWACSGRWAPGCAPTIFLSWSSPRPASISPPTTTSSPAWSRLVSTSSSSASRHRRRRPCAKPTRRRT